jgi:hypothetical protein
MPGADFSVVFGNRVTAAQPVLFKNERNAELRDVATCQIVTVGKGRGIFRDLRLLTLLALRYRC